MVSTNMSAISWREFYWWRKHVYRLENQRPATIQRHTLSHNVASSTSHHERDSNSL